VLTIMSLEKAEGTGFEIVDWKVALREFMGEI
jgi:dTDP-4-dehydrorhamnose reductase